MTSELLYKYFAGKLSEQETEQIMQWAEASDENRRRLFRERKAFDVMMLQDGDHLRELVSERVRPARRMTFTLNALRRVAAAVAIVLAVSWSSVRITDYYRIYPEQTITTPAGERIDITLSDGTKVCLNGRSSLTYPTAFNRRSRTVKLDGQAYFDVTPSKSTPFVVTTEKGRIEVMGTQFDVTDYAGAETFETALMTGKVQVSLNTTPEGGYTITPGMKIFLRDGKLVREYIEDYYAYMWRDGLIAFKEASFEQIMADLQKNYDIRIIVGNNRLTDVSYTGKFRTSDGIDYALKVLQKDVAFTYTRSEDHKTIYID